MGLLGLWLVHPCTVSITALQMAARKEEKSQLPVRPVPCASRLALQMWVGQDLGAHPTL